MLITYCSNDTSAKYGPTVFAVEAGMLPHEDAESAVYTHKVPLDVVPDNIWGCPTALVIDTNTRTFVYPDPLPLTPEQEADPEFVPEPLVGEWVTSTAVRPKTDAEFVADMKPGKLSQAQTEKSRACDSGFMVGATHFDSDAAARLAYVELAMALQQTPAFTTAWKASDGSWVTMNAALFAQVYAAGSIHIASCFAWQAAKIAEILAATTQAELNAITMAYA